MLRGNNRLLWLHWHFQCHTLAWAHICEFLEDGDQEAEIGSGLCSDVRGYPRLYRAILYAGATLPDSISTLLLRLYDNGGL